jgi:hypothetical protein
MLRATRQTSPYRRHEVIDTWTSSQVLAPEMQITVSPAQVLGMAVVNGIITATAAEVRAAVGHRGVEASRSVGWATPSHKDMDWVAEVLPAVSLTIHTLEYIRLGAPIWDIY